MILPARKYWRLKFMDSHMLQLLHLHSINVLHIKSATIEHNIFFWPHHTSTSPSSSSSPWALKANSIPFGSFPLQPANQYDSIGRSCRSSCNKHFDFPASIHFKRGAKWFRYRVWICHFVREYLASALKVLLYKCVSFLTASNAFLQRNLCVWAVPSWCHFSRTCSGGFHFGESPFPLPEVENPKELLQTTNLGWRHSGQKIASSSYHWYSAWFTHFADYPIGYWWLHLSQKSPQKKCQGNSRITGACGSSGMPRDGFAPVLGRT